MFVYRIVSFVLVALAGWVVFFLFYRGAVDVDPDADPLGEDGPGEQSSSSSPSSSSRSSRTAPPRATVAAAPPAGLTAMWPLHGNPWRPTVAHDSGPLPLLRVREREDGTADEESGESSQPFAGREAREEKER